MRKRRVAAVAVFTVSATSMLPVTARADAAPTTIYVNHASASCTDDGSGTQAAPFCTLQPGIDAAAVPGDTVIVLGGAYEYGPATISNSGTSSAPITIEPGTKSAEVGAPPTSTAPAFTFSGASYVTVKGFVVADRTSRIADISGSNHITMDGDLGGLEVPSGSTGPATNTLPGIEISSSSSDVTLSRNQIDDLYRDAASIQVDPGSTGDVITTNGIRAGLPAILVDGAPDTAVTSNSVILAGGYLCSTAVSLTGASTGSYVENNALETGTQCDSSSTPSALLSIASAAIPGTTVDYNDLDPNPNLNPLPGNPEGPDEYTYAWAGKYYETVAQFNAAGGQGQHDAIGNPDIGNPWGFLVASQAMGPNINSANSDAPGELATDLNGASRVDDPLVADTGAGTYAYYDRGATQIQPTFFNTVTAQAVGELGVRAASQAWSSTGYTIDFGDGSGPMPAAYGTASHTYAVPGTYTISVSGTSTVTGQPFDSTTSFSTTALSGGQLFRTGRNSNNRWWSDWYQGPTGSTNLAQAAITAMPDGDAQVVAVTANGTLEHTILFASNGEWQNWGVPKNNATVVSAGIAGMPDGSSQLIEVTSAGTLEHTIRFGNNTWQTGWGTPAGSTGIAQAAITAMPNGDSQIVAVTTSGVLEYNIRYHTNSWQGWRVLSQPGVKVTDASIAGMPNGTSQLVEVTSTGTLMHRIRYANGTWQANWGVPAGSTGIAEAAITAMPNGDSQIAAVTTTGVLKHDIRFANNTWQTTGWGEPVQTNLAVGVTSPSIAGFPDNSSQLIEISTN